MIVLEDPRYPAVSFCRALEERGVPVETMPIWGHFDPLLLPRLIRKLRALRPDLVHTHLIHADLYGLPAAKWAGVPAVVSSRHARMLSAVPACSSGLIGGRCATLTG